MVRLGCDDQPSISAQLREHSNSSTDQQAHLGYPAEGDGSVRLCGEPVACRHVVNVALSGERNPYVDIRQ